MKIHFYVLIVTSKLFFDNKRLMNDFEVFSAYVWCCEWNNNKADLKLIANQLISNLKHGFFQFQLIKFHGHKKSAKCQFTKILSWIGD